MRLINTSTLAIEEFVGQIPWYAILSHRWDINQNEASSLETYYEIKIITAYHVKTFSFVLLILPDEGIRLGAACWHVTSLNEVVENVTCYDCQRLQLVLSSNDSPR
jgi:hypothetical protein